MNEEEEQKERGKWWVLRRSRGKERRDRKRWKIRERRLTWDE